MSLRSQGELTEIAEFSFMASRGLIIVSNYDLGLICGVV